MDDHPSYLTAKQLAKQLKVSPDTVRAWARRGVIPILRISPKVVRFDPIAVLRAISAASARGGAK